MSDMAMVQLIIPNGDRDRFVNQARREGMSLSAWLRAAAEDRLERQARAEGFRSVADLRAFFTFCDALAGKGEEPYWEQHRLVIESSRRSGASDT